MNYLELVEFFMDEYGMDEENACRCADLELIPDYNSEDYE